MSTYTLISHFRKGLFISHRLYLFVLKFRPFYFVVYQNQCSRFYQIQCSHKYFSNHSTSIEISHLVEDIIGDDNNAQINRNEIIKVLNFFISYGCSPQELREKYLDYLRMHHCSHVKVLLLAEMNYYLPFLIPLFTLSVVKLKLIAKRTREDKAFIKDFPHRIDYLSHHLQILPEELILQITKHPILLTQNFLRIDNKMTILKDAKIDTTLIVKDLWIFNYKEELLAKRIDAAKGAGLILKPWLLRCTEEFFFSYLVKWKKTQHILSGNDEMSYLALKLDCSTTYIAHMMERNKSLKNVNIPKIEQIINFLYEKDYTAAEIRITPQIFCSSLKTLVKRFDEYCSIKKSRPTISQLGFNEKKFFKTLGKFSE